MPARLAKLGEQTGASEASSDRDKALLLISLVADCWLECHLAHSRH